MQTIQEYRLSVKEAMRRWPCLVAHMICESLGYACPSTAARIVLDGANGRKNWCEWVASCYGGDARKPLANAILTRRYHRGYMADFRYAVALVRHAIATDEEPLFASWF